MAYSVLVNVLDTTQDLLKELACLLFLESFSLDDIFKQLSAAGILQDEIGSIAETEGRYKASDAWMRHGAEDCDLSVDGLLVS